MQQAREVSFPNWYRARGQSCTGVFEILKNKIRMVIRRPCGVRTYEAME
jgi:hypothetical protein